MFVCRGFDSLIQVWVFEAEAKGDEEMRTYQCVFSAFALIRVSLSNQQRG